MNDQLTNIIYSLCREFEVSHLLIAAIIYEESRFIESRRRFEIGWFNRLLPLERNKLLGYVPPEGICSLDTEKADRSTSWGLMQVLGETARERGFRKESFLELLKPAINLEHGVSYFKRMLRLKVNEKDALLAYNGGADKGYPERVYSHIKEGRTVKFLAD